MIKVSLFTINKRNINMQELYLFPYKEIEKEKNIILYGAGNVGKQFYNQVRTSSFCNVVLWVDKEYLYYSERNYPVKSISEICSASYDYVVIAILNEQIANEVRNELINNYNVEPEKIIWDHYSFFSDSIEDVIEKNDSDYEQCLNLISPELILKSDSMEHMVRYLFCKDLINGISVQKHKSLYQRFVMTSTSAHEEMIGNTKLFSSYSQKQGLDQYLADFKKLIASFQREGCLNECPLPMGKNGYLANGKHRYATALALEKKIWVRNYATIDGHFKNVEWFRQNGFSEQDILMLLRAFCDLYDECGLFILYGAVYEFWNYITTKIGKSVKIVGYSDIEFKDDYIGFINLIRDNYRDNEKEFANIEQKIHFLLLAPLKIRVLVVSNENSNINSNEFYIKLNQIKSDIRKELFSDTSKHTIIIHGSDSKEEFNHMKKIWLSTNNIEYAGKRILNRYSIRFRQLINEFKDYLKTKDIPIGEVCIVGSAGMELFGLKCADDIDFCISSKFRYRVKSTELPEDIHIKKPDSVKIGDDCVYMDDLVINNDELHYVFDDIKFLNLDILREFKKFRSLEKDEGDVRKLEVFFDSVKAFNEKRQLRIQMEREIGRNW